MIIPPTDSKPAPLSPSTIPLLTRAASIAVAEGDAHDLAAAVCEALSATDNDRAAALCRVGCELARVAGKRAKHLARHLSADTSAQEIADVREACALAVEVLCA